MFQSSLELSPECNALEEFINSERVAVSILTRAFARVQHSVSIFGSELQLVSILTRAFARVQLGGRTV